MRIDFDKAIRHVGKPAVLLSGEESIPIFLSLQFLTSNEEQKMDLRGGIPQKTMIAYISPGNLSMKKGQVIQLNQRKYLVKTAFQHHFKDTPLYWKAGLSFYKEVG